MDKQVLTAEDFADFFRDVHDCEPFPWQRRLTAEVLGRGAWPKVIDLPTGTGKTAVLDTAVFAMAAQPQIFPRRIVFVIDRRIVVDQVYERARRIRKRLKKGETQILRRLRDRLSALSGGESLGVVALRGGIPIDNEWTQRPDQPWVMVSTVDQFGSRLLFRGYGTSSIMRPIHAGLAGNDCLVILDEVHLSVPFAETLSSVADLKSDQLPRRFCVVEMSATPSDAKAERFKLNEADDLKGCEELRRRVQAPKRAEMISVRNHDALPAQIVKTVKSMRKLKPEENIRSVGVVVNRVRTARETHQALEKAGYSAHLITGRMRPLDRIETLDRIAPAVNPDAENISEELTVVVATQAIEVGADFSFDALITECAPIDSMRQRFGRLDRRGDYFCRTSLAARAWIIGPKSVVASKKPDPIYGDSVKATWEELERLAREGSIDVGPLSLSGFPEKANAPRSSAPLLLKTHMDAWAQTGPEPIIQPPLEWFLHGMDQDRAADVSVLWRWDRSSDALRLVPPRPAEFLQVPIDAAKSWLTGGEEVDIADVSRSGVNKDEISLADENAANWVRWTGFDKGSERVTAGEIRPGDVIVVDPGRGGLRAGTWNPSSTDTVVDVGDAAQVTYGKRATLRLDRRLLGAALPELPGDESESDISIRESISLWLSERSSDQGDMPDWFFDAVKRLSDNFEAVRVGVDDEIADSGYYILIERDSNTKKPVVDENTRDGSDQSGSITGTGVTLMDHLEGVGDRAGRIAERLGLPVEFAEDIRLAGRLHDLGKVDRRFQARLVGGDPVELALLEEPLAKSRPGVRGGGTRLYPTGMRHEAASVAMVESNPDILASAHDKDLVLHLISTHHGWGRPLVPIVEDPEPETLSYEFDGKDMQTDSSLAEGDLAVEMADRFWSLVERYGYHGLAWLETVLRLADHQQSAEESK